MHRTKLLQAIDTYKKSKWCLNEDFEIASQFIYFITHNNDCFLRELEKGHLTASCWLWNKSESACLFTLHKKLKKWLQLGGHADGEHDLLKAALKEAKEESGIEDIEPLTTEIFDLHIHRIPENPKEKAHDHFDVRYILKTTQETPYTISDESIDLKWIFPEDFINFKLDPSILKMWKKLQDNPFSSSKKTDSISNF